VAFGAAPLGSSRQVRDERFGPCARPRHDARPMPRLARHRQASSELSSREICCASSVSRRPITAGLVVIDGPHMAPLGSPLALGQAIRDHLAWAAECADQRPVGGALD